MLWLADGAADRVTEQNREGKKKEKEEGKQEKTDG